MGRKIPLISNSEWWILRELWKSSPLEAKEIIDRVGQPHEWSPRTVKSLIHRLVKKGALTFEVTGKAYEYSPAVNEQECLEAERQELQQKTSKKSSLRLIASFIEEAELSADDLDTLKKLIEKKGTENVR